jgi:vesicle-fusing ATPase
VNWKCLLTLIASYGVAPCPSDPLALTNRLVVHPADFPHDVEFVVVRDKYIFSIM